MRLSIAPCRGRSICTLTAACPTAPRPRAAGSRGRRGRARHGRADRPRLDRGLGGGLRRRIRHRPHGDSRHGVQHPLRAGRACTCSRTSSTRADGGIIAETARIREARLRRAESIVARLAADYDIDWEDVLAQTTRGSDGRAPAHRRRARGARVTCPTAARRSRASCTRGAATTSRTTRRIRSTAVQLVRAAGGVPVLAHPGDQRVATSVIAGGASPPARRCRPVRPRDRPPREHRRRQGRGCVELAREVRTRHHRLERLPRRGQAEPAGREHHRARGARAHRRRTATGLRQPFARLSVASTRAVAAVTRVRRRGGGVLPVLRATCAVAAATGRAACRRGCLPPSGR